MKNLDILRNNSPSFPSGYAFNKRTAEPKLELVFFSLRVRFTPIPDITLNNIKRASLPIPKPLLKAVFKNTKFKKRFYGTEDFLPRKGGGVGLFEWVNKDKGTFVCNFQVYGNNFKPFDQAFGPWVDPKLRVFRNPRVKTVFAIKIYSKLIKAYFQESYKSVKFELRDVEFELNNYFTRERRTGKL